MSCGGSVSRRLLTASSILRCRHSFGKTQPLRNPGKIVIPVFSNILQTPRQDNAQAGLGASASSTTLNPRQQQVNEYSSCGKLNVGVAQFLDSEAADTLKRQKQLENFRIATDNAAVTVWHDSKSHLRRQEKLVKDLGVEGAVRELLQPTRVSFRQELKQRPLDRGILEEIYKGLHGKRIERQLKRGVSWEHWITKGDGTAPVFTASKKAQQTFAFGGQIKLIAKATHAKQFPHIIAGGRHKGRNMSPLVAETHRLVPEIAFIGRTSSGKSSLVNALVNAMIAPYGHLQGTTNSVNFYSIANRVVLVDCPGYGYYNPMETPQVDAENAVATMRAYLAACSPYSKEHMKGDVSNVSVTSLQVKGCPTGYNTPVNVGSSTGGKYKSSLHCRNSEEKHKRGCDSSVRVTRPIKRVLVCVSARGLQHGDLAYLDHLESLALPFSVVLTKTDAAPIRFLARLADHTRCQLVHYKHCKELFLASSLRLAGIDKIQNLIGGVALEEDKLHGATTDFSSIV
ncbi:putative 50S ribosome binding GTPase putative Dynamin family [Trypanosoma vivax]|uniref:G domain-containing protein n=1 Tax=Trypanosoma vivax (strain Y486) TaxID=1055687 RepID=G0U0L8_TRYVY|nr:hypothetical protein TRVL_06133 [Trypanosoma vivax]KAH8610866.1 putative 50S ribosome binding GTPase putative Dynamin family [Trypanosoma vivax]CCC49617.1 conserved hypothetical protein [Trypanosoma vivax Y486]